MKKEETCKIPCYKPELVARLRDEMPADEIVQALAAWFGLLADPTRLRIIGALSAAAELCVCDVANIVGLSFSATSHQLRKLRDAGAVSYRNDGRMAYYRLKDGALADALRDAETRYEKSAA